MGRLEQLLKAKESFDKKFIEFRNNIMAIHFRKDGGKPSPGGAKLYTVFGGNSYLITLDQFARGNYGWGAAAGLFTVSCVFGAYSCIKGKAPDF
ncbi:hypothetical protein ACFLZZ_00610 [Nanoarchaeota archaeon]